MPQYGTLKIDEILYNDSGTDVTLALGDIAVKSSPAFTGTATGVNLTLSGDLQVNGTTTTINTTTLQVEDKNIEIGKVASPSDATADGGGWSLLGSTIKTFNWLNATDSWTSSEHIEIASGKNLKVDGTTFFVDGTNNRVGIGLTGPNSKFQVNDTNPVIAEFYHSDGGDNDEARIALGAYSSNPPAQRGVTLVAKNNSAGHDFIVNTSSSHSAGPTEKMRIDSSGSLMVGCTAVENNAIAQFSSSTGSGALGSHVTIENTSTDSVNNTARVRLKTDSGVAQFIAYRAPETYVQSRAGGTSDLLLVADGASDLKCMTNGSVALTINSSQNATFAGSVQITGQNTSHGAGRLAIGYEGGSKNQLRSYGANSSTKGTFEFIGTTSDGSANDPTITFAAGNGTFGGTVSDSKGNLRSIPRLDKTSAYTITAADAGKTITADGNITIPNSVMSEGDAVTIIADGTGDITITQGSGLTMYNAADASTGNRTLALRGMATIWFKHTSYAYISGAGLS